MIPKKYYQLDFIKFILTTLTTTMVKKKKQNWTTIHEKHISNLRVETHYCVEIQIVYSLLSSKK